MFHTTGSIVVGAWGGTVALAVPARCQGWVILAGDRTDSPWFDQLAKPLAEMRFATARVCVEGGSKDEVAARLRGVHGFVAEQAGMSAATRSNVAIIAESEPAVAALQMAVEAHADLRCVVASALPLMTVRPMLDTLNLPTVLMVNDAEMPAVAQLQGEQSLSSMLKVVPATDAPVMIDALRGAMGVQASNSSFVDKLVSALRGPALAAGFALAVAGCFPSGIPTATPTAAPETPDVNPTAVPPPLATPTPDSPPAVVGGY